jgi:hypothetical protein
LLAVRTQSDDIVEEVSAFLGVFKVKVLKACEVLREDQVFIRVGVRLNRKCLRNESSPGFPVETAALSLSLADFSAIHVLKPFQTLTQHFPLVGRHTANIQDLQMLQTQKMLINA